MRSGIRRNDAPGYSWPSLLYQDLSQNNMIEFHKCQVDDPAAEWMMPGG